MLFEPDTNPLDPDQALTHCVRRLSNGAKLETVQTDLMARGTAEDLAATIARRALVLKTAAFRKKGWDLIGIGAVVGLAGLGITLVTFSAAEGGGVFILTYGAMISGVASAGRGVWLLITNREL